MDSQERRPDPIADAANTARIAVHLEQAYDIIDEMASNPNNYRDSLYKLSRLITKVLNDLEKNSDKFRNSEYRKRVFDSVSESLKFWSRKLDQLIEYLSSKSDKEFEKEVRRFAALAISPDHYSLEVKKALEGE